jgi:putative hydrolase of the HAD superfamily
LNSNSITALFLDVGGVLLTNGWDREARKRAVAHFNLDKDETDDRHNLTFDTYESGKLTLDEYLNRVVFYKDRSFSKDDFRAFMFEQSHAYQDTIDFFMELKTKYRLKVIAVNNEGKELNEYRIHKFKLGHLFDAFVSSCYVHFRKPDADLFLNASQVSQKRPAEIIYVDDRLMFVEVACGLGFHGLHYTGLEDAKKQLARFGLI